MQRGSLTVDKTVEAYIIGMSAFLTTFSHQYSPETNRTHLMNQPRVRNGHSRRQSGCHQGEDCEIQSELSHCGLHCEGGKPVRREGMGTLRVLYAWNGMTFGRVRALLGWIIGMKRSSWDVSSWRDRGRPGLRVFPGMSPTSSFRPY